MDIRPAIQAMSLYDIQELITLLVSPGPPRDETDRLFLQELLEQWRLGKNRTREEEL